MPKFTVETASEMGKRSVALRKQREIEREQALLNPVPLPVLDEVSTDTFSPALSQACIETLELVRKERNPQQRAQLARALRDLRETWHLATGKPRPGQTRPDAQPSRQSMPRVYPGYTGQGPQGQNPQG